MKEAMNRQLEISSLTNEEKINLYNRLTAASHDLYLDNNLKARNKLVKPITELYKTIDWGFKVGDAVSYNDKKVFIREHDERNYFLIKKRIWW